MAHTIKGVSTPRITGHDYFASLLDRLNQEGGKRIFFFGSSDWVLQLIEGEFKIACPNLEIAGTFSPPFRAWGEEENNEMVRIINSSHADVLWIGMTAPKQGKWVLQNCSSLNTPVIGSIGAVFDFFADTCPRAPEWMCKYGVEWLYRLASEPKRMWRRNFISTPRFVFAVLIDRYFS